MPPTRFTATHPGARPDARSRKETKPFTATHPDGKSEARSRRETKPFTATHPGARPGVRRKAPAIRPIAILVEEKPGANLVADSFTDSLLRKILAPDNNTFFFMRIKMQMLKTFPLNRVFTLIEPGPVLLVATAIYGKRNVMTISWSMAMDFSPKLAILTGEWNHSFEALMKTKQCVVAIPGADLAETALRVGACSGTDIDKFLEFQLSPMKAKRVCAPLLGECLYNIECVVSDWIPKHGIVVLEGVQAWENPDRSERRMFHAVGDGTFRIDGETVSLRHLMEEKAPPGI